MKNGLVLESLGARASGRRLPTMRTGVALLLLAGVVACSGAPASGDADRSAATGGRATAFLAEVPLGVACVEVDVAGARNVTSRFDVTANQDAVLSLTGLPLGAVTFTGLAYPTACAAVTDPTQATWISPATAATLAAQQVASVSLTLVPNGEATVGIGFQPDDAGADDAGTDDGAIPGDASPVGTPPDAPTNVSVSAATVTTLAGSGAAAYADGVGAAASFNRMLGLAVNTTGNVFVGDTNNNRVRLVSPSASVSTFAGSTPGFVDAPATTAKFLHPAGVAVDPSGNVYVADTSNNRIRKISPFAVVTTLAGSGSAGYVDASGTAASFSSPNGVALDAAGNVYVADSGNSRIRKVTPSGVVTTLAGSGVPAHVDGTGTAASFNQPWDVATDAAGNVYVSDFENHAIRKVTPVGVVTTLAGSGAAAYAEGTGSAASFDFPAGLTVDPAGNVYVADSGNDAVRKVTPAGVVTTVTGVTPFSSPYDVALDAANNLYVSGSNDLLLEAALLGAGQLAVTWSASSAAGITGYTASASAPGLPTQACSTGGATSCTLAGLVSGTNYSVSVTATNGGAVSGASAVSTGTPN